MYQLLCSYINNRKQYTECNNVKSDLKTMLCGVPQSSTLGPLLFFLYINDLPLHTKFHAHLSADDTVLMMKDKNISNLQLAVNQELCDVDNWMRYNRLSLNLLILFQPQNIKQTLLLLQLLVLYLLSTRLVFKRFLLNKTGINYV